MIYLSYNSFTRGENMRIFLVDDEKEIVEEDTYEKGIRKYLNLFFLIKIV